MVDSSALSFLTARALDAKRKEEDEEERRKVEKEEEEEDVERRMLELSRKVDALCSSSSAGKKRKRKKRKKKKLLRGGTRPRKFEHFCTSPLPVSSCSVSASRPRSTRKWIFLGDDFRYFTVFYALLGSTVDTCTCFGSGVFFLGEEEFHTLS